MTNHYYIEGAPIPLARARKGKNGFYDPQYEKRMGYGFDLQRQMKIKKIRKLDGILEMRIRFDIQVPKSWSSKKKNLFHGKPHISKPDTSNLIKFFEDCANGICFTDDSQIYRIIADKYWTNEYPSTSITLTEISE